MEDVKDIAAGEGGDEMRQKLLKHYGVADVKVPYSEFQEDMSKQVGNKNVSGGENDVDCDKGE